ncbi:hypothetical protein CASFOL_031894 [Castilleja foliolosa]|uniref:PHD-type domain-containing protein n=1 Tax=Castilleja foliolosa TaxID=1961234 RepID=A0ABD3BZX8_9LAMI
MVLVLILMIVGSGDEECMSHEEISKKLDDLKSCLLEEGELHVITLGKIVQGHLKFPSITDPSEHALYKMEVLRDPSLRIKPLFRVTTANGEECYGELEPNGGILWLCNLCHPGAPQSPPPCCLCPVVGGSMKPTTDGRWAHLTCAIWIPDVKLLNKQLGKLWSFLQKYDVLLPLKNPGSKVQECLQKCWC